MKIRQKLVLGFAGTASLVGIVGLICLNASQKALHESIAESSVALATETIDKIDRQIHNAIEELQIYSTDSTLQKALVAWNRQFEELGDIQDYIDRKEAEWTSTPPGTITPFVEELLNNELSEELKTRIEFHKRKQSREPPAEAFVTNRYGACIASTERTSDYRQDDEVWWQRARKDGLYVGDVEYDESAGVHCTPIAMKLSDTAGNFAGVVKVVLGIDQAIDVIKSAKRATKQSHTRFALIDKDGRVIFSEGPEFGFLDRTSNGGIFGELAGRNGYLIRKTDYRPRHKTLLAYARSLGCNDYHGLGWILTIEYDTTELFAPVISLRNIMLVTSAILTMLAVIQGLLISRHISQPLSKLKKAIDKIGKGNTDVQVEVKGDDEIGQLATAFNKMVEQRKSAEDALGVSQGKLNAMLRAIADDIALIDKDLNIIWTNDVAKEIFGDDIVGKKCYEAYHRRNRPCEPYPCPTLKAFQDGKVHQYESQVTDKTGRTRHFHTVANVA
ncbi:MAG: HAMP domain-containing protein, partial [Planctomycetota bacterium]